MCCEECRSAENLFRLFGNERIDSNISRADFYSLLHCCLWGLLLCCGGLYEIRLLDAGLFCHFPQMRYSIIYISCTTLPFIQWLESNVISGENAISRWNSHVIESLKLANRWSLFYIYFFLKRISRSEKNTSVCALLRVKIKLIWSNWQMKRGTVSSVSIIITSAPVWIWKGDCCTLTIGVSWI